jgi:hypothetical protein
MSLINDALKRASEAQQKAQQTPPPELKFREIDAREGGPKRFGWVLPSAITACVLLVAFGFWQMNNGHRGNPEKNVAPNAKPESGEKSSADTESLKVHAREQEPLPAAPLAAPKMPEPVQTENAAVVAVSGTTIQETTALSETAPKPGPKLQGIVFNPRMPSATISGKMVFVGEKVGDWKVVAINKESATLVGAAGTNILKLGE